MVVAVGIVVIVVVEIGIGEIEIGVMIVATDPGHIHTPPPSVVVIGENKVVVDHMINMVRGAVDEVDVVQCPIGVEVVAIA